MKSREMGHMRWWADGSPRAVNRRLPAYPSMSDASCPASWRTVISTLRGGEGPSPRMRSVPLRTAQNWSALPSRG